MYFRNFLIFLTKHLRVKKLLSIDICISLFFLVLFSKLLLGNTLFLCEPHKMLHEFESFLFYSFHGPDVNFETIKKFLKPALMSVSLEENLEFLRVLLYDEFTPSYKFLKFEDYLGKFSMIETQQKQKEELVNLILEVYEARHTRVEQMRYFFGTGTGIFIFGVFFWTILTINYLLGPRE